MVAGKEKLYAQPPAAADLAGIATLGDEHAQKTGTLLKTCTSDDKRDAMTIVPCVMSVLISTQILISTQTLTFLPTLAFVRQEIEVASAAVSLTIDPIAQPVSPTSPGSERTIIPISEPFAVPL